MSKISKPDWLKSKKIGSKKAIEIKRKLRKYRLHTVCESARCPNLGVCFDNGTATFMILGETCTRNCKFCAVNKSVGNLSAPDENEPENIAGLAKELNLKHVVITTVTRDDLDDGGASQFVKVIGKMKETCRDDISIEVLISDLKGDFSQLKKIMQAQPDVLNHNMETVSRLYMKVRPMADYERSLQILKQAKVISKNILTKSGIMVGLGETEDEVFHLMDDLRKIKVDILTIGQYMSPTKDHFPIQEYITPERFNKYEKEGLHKGFKLVVSDPLVRSSYHAEKAREFMN